MDPNPGMCDSTGLSVHPGCSEFIKHRIPTVQDIYLFFSSGEEERGSVFVNDLCHSPASPRWAPPRAHIFLSFSP